MTNTSRDGIKKMAVDFMYNEFISIDISKEYGVQYKLMGPSSRRYTSKQYRIIADYFGDAFVEHMVNKDRDANLTDEQITQSCLDEAFTKYEAENE